MALIITGKTQEGTEDMAKDKKGKGPREKVINFSDLEPKPPVINTQVGFKTTTVRLQTAQYDETELFARAVNESMAEYIRIALEDRTKRLAKDPRVQEGVKRQINQVQRMFDKVLARADDE